MISFRRKRQQPQRQELQAPQLSAADKEIARSWLLAPSQFAALSEQEKRELRLSITSAPGRKS